MPIDLAGFAYAAAVAAGGVFGYYKAGSIPSLGAGILFGSALAYGAWQVSRDPSNYSVQLASSSILAGVMGYRFYNSGKVMPGLVCGISVVMILRTAYRAAGFAERKIS